MVGLAKMTTGLGIREDKGWGLKGRIKEKLMRRIQELSDSGAEERKRIKQSRFIT